MLNLQREDIVNADAIGKWLFEDLKKLYGEIGYVQYMVEPELEFRVVDHVAKRRCSGF